jgi:hypothetical protein
MSSSEIQTLKSKLQAERDKLWQAAASLDPGEMNLSQPDGWSAREILAHVAFSERVNVKFARLTVETDKPVQLEAMALDFPDYPGPFSLDDFNAYLAGKWRDLPLEQVIVLFHATRAETLAWINSLAPEQLDRKGEHAVWGDETVRGMIRILALHDKMHAQEIRNLKREPAS